jgi:hypothetical protein
VTPKGELKRPATVTRRAPRAHIVFQLLAGLTTATLRSAPGGGRMRVCIYVGYDIQ